MEETGENSVDVERTGYSFEIKSYADRTKSRSRGGYSYVIQVIMAKRHKTTAAQVVLKST